MVSHERPRCRRQPLTRRKDRKVRRRKFGRFDRNLQPQIVAALKHIGAEVQRNGEQFSKFFSDAKFWNNAECSLLAAIHERDEFIRDRSEAIPKLPFREHTLSNNSTGINGVSFARSEGKRGAFVASWKLPDGRNKNRKFNINKYGFHEALRLAIEARQNWEEEMRQQFSCEQDEDGECAAGEIETSQPSFSESM